MPTKIQENKKFKYLQIIKKKIIKKDKKNDLDNKEKKIKKIKDKKNTKDNENENENENNKDINTSLSDMEINENRKTRKKKNNKNDKDDKDDNILKEKINSTVRVRMIMKNEKRENIYIPWTEKYRPKRLKNVVSQKTTNILENALKTGEFPNLLIYGKPGTGKTTSVTVTCKQLFGPEKYKERVLELNASDERGINIVRGKIISFSKVSIGNADKRYLCPPFKVIILDEADEMTKEAQSALRKVMEEYLHITRFVFICNYPKHIIEPINSRCVKIRFNPISKENMIDRLTEISSKENLNIEKSAIEGISYYTNGDLRKSISMLQNLKYIQNINKIILRSDVDEMCKYMKDEDFIKIKEEIINGDEEKKIKILINKTNEILNRGFVFESIMIKMIEYIKNKKIDDKLKAKILFNIGSIDKKINDNSSEYIQLLNLMNIIRTTK